MIENSGKIKTIQRDFEINENESFVQSRIEVTEWLDRMGFDISIMHEDAVQHISVRSVEWPHIKQMVSKLGF